MGSWFSKVFEKKKLEESVVTTAAQEAVEAERAPETALPQPRKVISAAILADADSAAEPEGGIAIKAKLDEAKDTVTFLFDRQLLDGYSSWCADRKAAEAASPLAQAVFDAGGAGTVLVYASTLAVTRDGTGREGLEDYARRIGGVLRESLLAGVEAASPDFLEGMPSEEEFRTLLQEIIDVEINPGIASHSGVITLNRVRGNTAYITMGGGCQGCAASSITLRSGIETSFRNVAPKLGALLDETDHEAGANPYFTDLPAGMGV
jgi:Fe-S cluster biogenesis protein NfuA